MPRSDSELYVGKSQAGSVPGFKSPAMASGDPLTSDTSVFEPSRASTSATADMRWRAEEKWCRWTIFTDAGTAEMTACGTAGFATAAFGLSPFFAETRPVGGVAVEVFASYFHDKARIAVSSIGSPTNSSGSPSSAVPAETSEWHAAMTTAAAADAPRMGNSLTTPVDAESQTTPTGTNLSVVSVPVLSNKQCSTRPAKGTR
mmetsp:Transcript_27783/g.93391  ORF Transcript_27783/g.93391 Transcript_27783/m.93391 type:complete len:202 (+) Transcript_27783:2401-3006(+)